MKEVINKYLRYLDRVIDNIPRIEEVIRREIIIVSYGLINSKNILVDISYLDSLFDFLYKKKYINSKCYLRLGEYLGEIINGLKVINNF